MNHFYYKNGVIFIRCKRCDNEFSGYFYYGDNGCYCRKCIKFMNQNLEETEIKEVDSEYKLSFSLTDKQKDISQKLVSAIIDGYSVLLEAVCGAGKTEIVYQTISEMLKKKKRVGMAISRRQVVLEIAQRMQEVFTNIKVVPVCQGHNDILQADLVICTTHQLYRYNKYFDLLIIDEPDAFPFKGNDILQAFAKNSCKGQIIYLTATPDDKLVEEVKKGKLKYLYLARRPSGRDLPVPKLVYGNKTFLLMYLFYYLKKYKNKSVLVFVPTIKWGKILYFMFRYVFKCTYINSGTEDKDKKIKEFKDGKYKICFSTTVLERGITIKKVNVIIFLADHRVFDEASLIQSSGRVGRSIDDPEGFCLFLAETKSESIDNCLKRIKFANEN